jgi:hypothetical protein
MYLRVTASHTGVVIDDGLSRDGFASGHRHAYAILHELAHEVADSRWIAVERFPQRGATGGRRKPIVVVSSGGGGLSARLADAADFERAVDALYRQSDMIGSTRWHSCSMSRRC